MTIEYNQVTYFLGISNGRNLTHATIDEASKDSKLTDFVAGAPLLVKDGEINIDWGNKYSSYIDGVHLRTAFGFNKNNLVLLCTDNKVNINELANIGINNFGLTTMINCDGGGSCHLQNKTDIFKKSTRSNVSWLLVYLVNEDESIVKVDNKEYFFNTIVKDGYTYIKLRDFEQAGYTIGYENSIPSINKPK